VAAIALANLVDFKYLRYSCEVKDFGHEQDEMRLNFVKTESFGPKKVNSMP
jgi:hypothetical protein